MEVRDGQTATGKEPTNAFGVPYTVCRLNYPKSKGTS